MDYSFVPVAKVRGSRTALRSPRDQSIEPMKALSKQLLITLHIFALVLVLTQTVHHSGGSISCLTVTGLVRPVDHRENPSRLPMS